MFLSGLDVLLVMDNYSTHKTPAIRRWLARHPRWHVHFTPTAASWSPRCRAAFDGLAAGLMSHVD